MTTREAVRMGVAAHNDGVARTSNPFPPSRKREHQAWLDGWGAAKEAQNVA